MLGRLLLISVMCLSLLGCTEADPNGRTRRALIRSDCDNLIGLEWMSCKMNRGVFNYSVVQQLGFIGTKAHGLIVHKRDVLHSLLHTEIQALPT